MAHNFQKISAPFGRATPKDRLVILVFLQNLGFRCFMITIYDEGI